MGARRHRSCDRWLVGDSQLRRVDPPDGPGYERRHARRNRQRNPMRRRRDEQSAAVLVRCRLRDAPDGRNEIQPYVNSRRKRRNAPRYWRRFVKKSRRRPTLPGGLPPSTIGAGGLNCRVRDGNGCVPAAMVTGNLVVNVAPPWPEARGGCPTRTSERARTLSKVNQALGRLVPVG